MRMRGTSAGGTAETRSSSRVTASDRSGSVNVKRLPLPTSLATQIRPPMIATTSATLYPTSMCLAAETVTKIGLLIFSR